MGTDTDIYMDTYIDIATMHEHTDTKNNAQKNSFWARFQGDQSANGNALKIAALYIHQSSDDRHSRQMTNI